MRRKKSWILVIMAAAFLAFTTSGCVEPLESNVPGIDPDAVKLPIRLYIPGTMPATKASARDVDGVSPESQIYSVQVWMFNHYDASSSDGNNEKAVAYAEVGDITWNQSTNLPNGSGYYKGEGGYTEGGWTDEDTYQLSLWIPGSVLDRDSDKLKFDFYVLANAESVGCSANPTTTRGELKALTFGYTSATVDPFGSYDPKTGATPTLAINGTSTNGPGLPICGFFNKSSNTDNEGKGVDLKNLKGKTTISPEEIHTYIPIVQLERAVSKIRFVFAAPVDMTNIAITSITLDSGIIPDATYVFPRENGSGIVLPGSTYSSSTTSVLAPTTIGRISDPNYLRSTCDSTFTIGTTTYKKPNQMTAQEYDSFLSAAVTAGNATESYVYLRESDKPVKGKITYTLDGGTTTKTADFYMPSAAAAAAVTNFHRNHSWTVYAYFSGGVTLEIWPYAMPWIYHETTTTFSSQVQCDGISVSGAIENTEAYKRAHNDSENNYLSNYQTGEVPSTDDPNFYDRYYQVRRLDHGSDAQGYFEFKFTPRAPYGGYWMLEPEFFGPHTDHGSPSDMFRIEVQLADGATSSTLEGQIIDREVTIRIYPSSNYHYADDFNSYSVIFKSYFSPTKNFEPAYSADSEVQDVHGDGRYSYWRFTLTHGEW